MQRATPSLSDSSLARTIIFIMRDSLFSLAHIVSAILAPSCLLSGEVSILWNEACGMKQHRAELLTKWRGLISEQSQSGQTVRAFCHDRGLRNSLFCDWKKRLREGETVKFVEVKVKEAGEQRKPAAEHSPAIQIRLNKGRSVFVEPGFDANHLRALLAVLEVDL